MSLIALTLFSCQKSKDDTPAYHLTAKIDGVKLDFSSSLAAQFGGDAQNGYTLDIVGIGGNANIVERSLVLNIIDNAPVVAKTYTAALGNAECSFDTDNPSMHSDTNFTITFTSITTKEVKGSFSGVVEDGLGKITNITEGAFSAILVP
ncbi:MAG: hypothetical protein ACXWWC_08945 [Chitinophagaceae bacterium]